MGTDQFQVIRNVQLRRMAVTSAESQQVMSSGVSPREGTVYPSDSSVVPTDALTLPSGGNSKPIKPDRSQAEKTDDIRTDTGVESRKCSSALFNPISCCWSSPVFLPWCWRQFCPLSQIWGRVSHSSTAFPLVFLRGISPAPDYQMTYAPSISMSGPGAVPPCPRAAPALSLGSEFLMVPRRFYWASFGELLPWTNR